VKVEGGCSSGWRQLEPCRDSFLFGSSVESVTTFRAGRRTGESFAVLEHHPRGEPAPHDVPPEPPAALHHDGFLAQVPGALLGEGVRGVREGGFCGRMVPARECSRAAFVGDKVKDTARSAFVPCAQLTNRERSSRIFGSYQLNSMLGA
jgi:hypothetical protein